MKAILALFLVILSVPAMASCHDVGNENAHAFFTSGNLVVKEDSVEYKLIQSDMKAACQIGENLRQAGTSSATLVTVIDSFIEVNIKQINSSNVGAIMAYGYYAKDAANAGYMGWAK